MTPTLYPHESPLIIGFVLLLIGVIFVSGCVSEQYPSSFEITNIWVRPQILIKESQNIAPVYTLIGFNIKNVGRVETKTFTIKANIYDINDEFICHGDTQLYSLQPRESTKISIHCWGKYAGDKTLKDPEIKFIENNY